MEKKTDTQFRSVPVSAEPVLDMTREASEIVELTQGGDTATYGALPTARPQHWSEASLERRENEPSSRAERKLKTAIQETMPRRRRVDEIERKDDDEQGWLACC